MEKRRTWRIEEVAWLVDHVRKVGYSGAAKHLGCSKQQVIDKVVRLRRQAQGWNPVLEASLQVPFAAPGPAPSEEPAPEEEFDPIPGWLRIMPRDFAIPRYQR